jgi:hypothetical protein
LRGFYRPLLTWYIFHQRWHKWYLCRLIWKPLWIHFPADKIIAVGIDTFCLLSDWNGKVHPESCQLSHTWDRRTSYILIVIVISVFSFCRIRMNYSSFSVEILKWLLRVSITIPSIVKPYKTPVSTVLIPILLNLEILVIVEILIWWIIILNVLMYMNPFAICQLYPFHLILVKAIMGKVSIMSSHISAVMYERRIRIKTTISTRMIKLFKYQYWSLQKRSLFDLKVG